MAGELQPSRAPNQTLNSSMQVALNYPQPVETTTNSFGGPWEESVVSSPNNQMHNNIQHHTQQGQHQHQQHESTETTPSANMNMIINNSIRQQHEPQNQHSFLREWIERRHNIPLETIQSEVHIPSLEVIRPKQKMLTNLERSQICQRLTSSFQGGKLKHGLINQLGTDYNVSRVTISTLWKLVHTQLKDGEVANLKRKYKGRTSTRVIDLEKVRNIPLEKRMNIRDLAEGLDLPCTTVWRLVKKGMIRSHSSSIRPLLTHGNKLARLHWVLGKICSSTLNGNLVFEAMFDLVHIDEKWFNITRLTQKYYLLPCERQPHRTTQSKRYITKIMCMAAVARPRFDEDGNCLFDGKIGIFPFTVTAPAKRGSKNRVRGTLEVKPIESITKLVLKECLLEKVIPAIKAKWPEGANRRIFIQQDNAKPHIIGTDLEFLQAAKSDVFDMDLVQQPPNSPDLNILDLGFFRSIQTIQHKNSSRTICELVEAVANAYETISNDKLKHVWVSLQACMKGGNNYSLPHIGKTRLTRLGRWENQLTPSTANMEISLDAINVRPEELSA